MGVGMDGKDVAEAVAAVAAMMGKIQNPKVKAAAKVVHKAAPAVAVAAQVAPAAAKAAAPVVKKAGRAAAGAAGAAKDKVVEVVGDGRDKMREKSRAASERKQQQMAQVEARKELLACAPVVIDAKTLKHDSGDCGDVSAGRFVSFPGCYVAITYGEKFSGKHIAEYREARVFYSDNVGRSIIDDIEGRGDADIYADVKYGQGVRFYLFPCDEENSAKLLESLSQVLVEDDSVEARA